MTSPSAAHTGIVPAEQVVAEAIAQGRVRERPVVDYGTNAEPSHQAMVDLARASAEALAAHGQFPAPHLLMATAELLVGQGDASWCPSCLGTGEITTYRLGAHPPVAYTGTCTRCRGGRLNPFHGCTFNAVDPCQCTDRCQAWTATHPHE